MARRTGCACCWPTWCSTPARSAASSRLLTSGLSPPSSMHDQRVEDAIQLMHPQKRQA
ncbi:MAG: hypothetical protein H6665_00030 [Ardenticatenaceae bacterium]|nr:hypothetical protein [Ardenticatenaceae bacterium]